MIAFLAAFKAKFWAIGAAVAGIAGLILRNKYLAGKADRATRRAESAEATIKRDKFIREIDAQIETDTDARTAEIAKEIEAGQPVKSLERPDEW